MRPDGYCPRCVMWIIFDDTHTSEVCDMYRNTGDDDYEQLAEWVEPIHPGWFLT